MEQRAPEQSIGSYRRASANDPPQEESHQTLLSYTTSWDSTQWAEFHPIGDYATNKNSNGNRNRLHQGPLHRKVRACTMETGRNIEMPMVQGQFVGLDPTGRSGHRLKSGRSKVKRNGVIACAPSPPTVEGPPSVGPELVEGPIVPGPAGLG